MLDKSRWSYRRFLTLCDAYDLLSASDKKLFEQTVDASSGAEPFFAAQANAGVRREEKIAKYRLEKELKMKIEVGNLGKEIPYANCTLDPNCPFY